MPLNRPEVSALAPKGWVVIALLVVIAALIGWILRSPSFTKTATRRWVAITCAIIVAVVNLGGVVFWPIWNTGSYQLYPYLHLSASAEEYDRFAEEHPIALTLSIALPEYNPGAIGVGGVQLYAPGTIHVKYLARDGVPIEGVSHGSALVAGGLYDTQQACLYHLRYGEWRIIPFEVASAGNGVWEISEVNPYGGYSEVLRNPVTNEVTVIEHPDHEITSYLLDQPGLYTLQLEYHDRQGYVADIPGYLTYDQTFRGKILGASRFQSKRGERPA